LNSEFVRTLEANFTEDYDMYGDEDDDDDDDEDPTMTMSHLKSLFLYTNFTKLCSTFSCVFRRIPSSESDDSFKTRNSNYREWARLLVETVHVFGTTMEDSTIKSFYHGISCPMTFRANFAVFHSPTSITKSSTVAGNFAKTSGIVLELQNNNSESLSYFDCCMSDFSHESEQLLINGGYQDFTPFCEKRFLALSFVSIYNFHLQTNFGTWVSAISAFQIIVTGKNAMNNQLRFKKSAARMLRTLIHNPISSDAETGKVNPLYYMQHMFDSYTQSLKKIQIFLPSLNLKKDVMDSFVQNPLFLKFRPILCDLFSDDNNDVNGNVNKNKNSDNDNKDNNNIEDEDEDEEETKNIIAINTGTDPHKYHEQGFINPIKSMKIGLLLNLCPSVLNIELIYLPLTRYLMQQILDVIGNRGSNEDDSNVSNNTSKIARFYICAIWHEMNDVSQYCYPPAQNDFESYEACVSEYKDTFSELEWDMKVVNLHPIGSNWLTSGVEIVSRARINEISTDVWEAFLG
jgi:hypothetical protein